MKIKPEIEIGVRVRRINCEHGSMEIGDTSVVIDRFDNGSL